MEYTGPVSELKEMCEIRIEVAGMTCTRYAVINLQWLDFLTYSSAPGFQPGGCLAVLWTATFQEKINKTYM